MKSPRAKEYAFSNACLLRFSPSGCSIASTRELWLGTWRITWYSRISLTDPNWKAAKTTKTHWSIFQRSAVFKKDSFLAAAAAAAIDVVGQIEGFDITEEPNNNL